jgi:hypothetical protein
MSGCNPSGTKHRVTFTSTLWRIQKNGFPQGLWRKVNKSRFSEKRNDQNVRFGSFVDILSSETHVRFAPESGHAALAHKIRWQQERFAALALSPRQTPLHHPFDQCQI